MNFSTFSCFSVSNNTRKFLATDKYQIIIKPNQRILENFLEEGNFNLQ